MKPTLTESGRRIALAVGRALLPATRFPRYALPAVERLEELLGGFDTATLRGYEVLLHTFENAARVPHFGRPFSSLSIDRAERFLARCAEGLPPQRFLVLGITAPMKVAYFDDPVIAQALGATHRFHATAERPRWMQQVTRGADLADDALEIECDVVVAGTGAGGAVVAKELAQKGLGVLMLEEGEYHLRDQFDGASLQNIRRFYRERGTLGTIGNTFIPLPMGRLVGGSTAVNTGTCWRTPSWVLERWVRERGLDVLAPDRMETYFERVERELQVQVTEAKYLGPVADVIARGCDALGFTHRPLMRNAPGCDGSSACDFGCPTDARRSTNVSYVPSALQLGASLYTGVRAERVQFQGDRVVGLEGRVLGTNKTLRVRARATIIAGGTVPTPLFLRKQTLRDPLPHLGRNLSIHPATMSSAMFDEPIRGYAHVPQGYCVDQFQRENILMLGASAPIDLGAAQFAFVGHKLMEIMERYDRIASFGVMVSDASRGAVREGPGGRPLVTYWLGREERRALTRGTAALARIFLAAGASEVYPGVHGHRIIRNERDIQRLEGSNPAAADWLMTAFHPLGTCRMATSNRDGVVSTDHEVFGMPGLFVCDGSVVPSSVAVNPQETIMAMSTRAADRIAERLS